MTGLRPGTVGLTLGKLEAFVFFVTILLVTFTLPAELDALSLGFDVFRGAAMLFVEVGFFTLFFGTSVSSALTSFATSSTNLAASSWLIVEADNNSATKTYNKHIFV